MISGSNIVIWVLDDLRTRKKKKYVFWILLYKGRECCIYIFFIPKEFHRVCLLGHARLIFKGKKRIRLMRAPDSRF